MYNLGQLSTSEFGLLGSISDDELLGAMERANIADKKLFAQRIKANQKAITVSNAPNNSRGEFEKRLHILPEEIRTGLANKTLQAVDVAFYVAKVIGGNRVAKLLRDDDNKTVGASNISSGKLEKGYNMLVHAIGLQYGIAAENGGVESVNFDVIPAIIRNGEFEFKANGTVLIPPTSCEVFDTTGTNRRRGIYILDNPKIIKDQLPIEFNLEWGVNAPERSFIKLVLYGTSVIKS